MSSSQPDAGMERLAAALAGTPVQALVPCVGGANNRVFRVESDKGRFALKFYPSISDDPRDRLGHEFAAFGFLAGRTVPGRVPRALAADRAAGAALYEWVEGAFVAPHDVADVAAVVDLLGELHRARPAASGIGPAIEPCLAPVDVLKRIEARMKPLERVAVAEPPLADMLEGIRLLVMELGSALDGVWAAQPLPGHALTLSPSDFGFHNALRRPDGRLTFIDFEYFGWDDPAKAVSDFLWHAGQRLNTAQRIAFAEGALGLYDESDPHFAERLAIVYPLHGLNWTLIVLNEFRPDRWERRRQAGQTGDWAEIKRRQLAKAERLMERVKRANHLRTATMIERIAETGDDT